MRRLAAVKWGPQSLNVGDILINCPQRGQLVAERGGSPTLRIGGETQLWPPGGQIGYIPYAMHRGAQPTQQRTKLAVAHRRSNWLHNPFCLGLPNTSERGTKSAMANKWAFWL